MTKTKNYKSFFAFASFMFGFNYSLINKLEEPVIFTTGLFLFLTMIAMMIRNTTLEKLVLSMTDVLKSKVT